MSQSILQRRLVDVSERLKRIRAELAVTEEQVVFLEEEAEDVQAPCSRGGDARWPTSRPAMPAGTPMPKPATATRCAATVRELEREQDSLLDRISAELSAR